MHIIQKVAHIANVLRAKSSVIVQYSSDVEAITLDIRLPFLNQNFGI